MGFCRWDSNSVTICIVFAMAACHAGGGPSLLVVWGLVVLPMGFRMISRRAERATVEEDAPESEEIEGDGVSRVGAHEGAILLTACA